MRLDMRALARPLQRLRPCIFMEAVAGVMVMPEPTAAAIAYGLDKKVVSERNVDLGGPNNRYVRVSSPCDIVRISADTNTAL